MKVERWRERERLTFSDLASEVSGPHFLHNLLVKGHKSPSRFKGREPRPPDGGGGKVLKGYVGKDCYDHIWKIQSDTVFLQVPFTEHLPCIL